MTLESMVLALLNWKMMINYSINKSTFQQVQAHLKQCSKYFVPELSSYVNIDDYSLKLFQKAIRVEAFIENDLIGLIAIYVNQEKKESFVTNVSVLPQEAGKGVAKKLFKKTITRVKKMKVNIILLEVDSTNLNAVSLYQKVGFDTLRDNEEKIIMKLNLQYEKRL